MYVVTLLIAVAPGGEAPLGGVGPEAHAGERMKNAGVGGDEGP